MRPFLLLLATAAAAFIVALQAPPRRFFSSEAPIPDSRVVRVVAKSHLSLVADLYWIRMSTLALSANLPPEGRRLLEWGQFVSDLDRGNKWVYMVGGLLGPIKLDNKLYNGPEAEALLQKGVTNVPSEFRLYLYLATQQIDLKKPAAASETLKLAMKVPRCPSYVGPLVARLLSEAGQLDAARDFAAHMAESEDPLEQERFRKRVLEIDREKVLTAVDAASSLFQQRMGRRPFDLHELMSQGLLAEEPVDPMGGTITLDANGRATVNSEKRLVLHRAPFEEAPEIQ